MRELPFNDAGDRVALIEVAGHPTTSVCPGSTAEVNKVSLHLADALDTTPLR